MSSVKSDVLKLAQETRDRLLHNMIDTTAALSLLDNLFTSKTRKRKRMDTFGIEWVYLQIQN